MSTRSVIARAEGDGWKGVYHHSDGYPTGLGCYIFRAIHHQFKGDARAFLDYALSHDAGWSHIFPATVMKRDRHGGETFDKSHPAAQCYCHGYFAQRDKTKPGQGLGVIQGCECGRKPYISGAASGDSPSCDPLFVEWVYVLDLEAHTMGILASTGEDIAGTVGYTTVHLDGSKTTEAQRAYRHKLVAVVGLHGPEPDWLEIECGPNLERCHHYRCLHGAPGCTEGCPYCHGTGVASRESLFNGNTWVDSILSPIGVTRARLL